MADEQDEQNPLYDNLVNRQQQTPGVIPPIKYGITDSGQGTNKPLMPADATEQGGWNGSGQYGTGVPAADATPVATPASPAPVAPVGQGNYQQWFQQLMGGANDQGALLSHAPELTAAGWHISPANANGEITKVQTPDGQWVRVIGNGEGHPVWNVQGNNAPGDLTRPFGSGIDSTKSNQLFDILMNRAKQSLDVNRNDPTIRRQVDAYGATAERSRRSYLQDLAENGGTNANISAEKRASAEQVGQGTASFEGQIMQQEINARRQEIMSALSGAQGNLSAEQQLQLQEELQQMSLAQTAYQFDANQEYLRSPLAPGAQG